MFSILLKQIKCEISPCLTILLNQCRTTGIFPEKFKIAKIIPILEKKKSVYDWTSCNNMSFNAQKFPIYMF